MLIWQWHPQSHSLIKGMCCVVDVELWTYTSLCLQDNDTAYWHFPQSAYPQKAAPALSGMWPYINLLTLVVPLVICLINVAQHVLPIRGMVVLMNYITFKDLQHTQVSHVSLTHLILYAISIKLSRKHMCVLAFSYMFGGAWEHLMFSCDSVLGEISQLLGMSKAVPILQRFSQALTEFFPYPS